MHWSVWAGLALLALSQTVWWSYIQVRFQIMRTDGDDRIDIDIKAVWGLIRLHYVIPFIRFRGILKGTVIRMEKTDRQQKETLSEKEHTYTFSTWASGRQKRRKLLKHVAGFYRWSLNTLRHIQCDKLEWNTRVGSSDAAVAAFVAGIIWAIKSSLVGWSTAFIRFRDPPQFSVSPIYHRDHFSTAGECILKIRLGYAIIAALLLLVRILRVKGGMRTWRNTRFKAS